MNCRKVPKPFSGGHGFNNIISAPSLLLPHGMATPRWRSRIMGAEVVTQYCSSVTLRSHSLAGMGRGVSLTRNVTATARCTTTLKCTPRAQLGLAVREQAFLATSRCRQMPAQLGAGQRPAGQGLRTFCAGHTWHRRAGERLPRPDAPRREATVLVRRMATPHIEQETNGFQLLLSREPSQACEKQVASEAPPARIFLHNLPPHETMP